jgi:hypothetical protein
MPTTTTTAEQFISEPLVQLEQLRKSPLLALAGKAPTVPSLIRWIKIGANTGTGRVVRLEGVRLGGRWMSSEGALKRFLARMASGGSVANA